METDPDVCWCGEYMDKHGIGSGHMGVPMGCVCYYDKVTEGETLL